MMIHVLLGVFIDYSKGHFQRGELLDVPITK